MSIIFLQNTPGFRPFGPFASRTKRARGRHLFEHCPLREEARSEYAARRAEQER